MHPLADGLVEADCPLTLTLTLNPTPTPNQAAQLAKLQLEQELREAALELQALTWLGLGLANPS